MERINSHSAAYNFASTGKFHAIVIECIIIVVPFSPAAGSYDLNAGKIQPSKTNNEKENQEEKVIDARLNRMTEEEVEGTESSEHLPYPTHTRYTQSHSDSLY